jgi:hypothetical protein
MRRVIDTRERVAELLQAGHTRLETARILGLAKSTVSYHARRLGLPIDDRCNRRYDWAEVQRFYDDGHSVAECQVEFGFARETWNQARRRGDIRPRPRLEPIEDILAPNRPRNRSHVRWRLLAAGLKEERCEECGLTEWRGRPIALQLHHVNGDGLDNSLENLRILCANCHAQTENWAGRGKRRAAA